MTKNDLIQALRRLRPQASYGVTDALEVVEFSDPNGLSEPTLSELQTALVAVRKTNLKAHVNTIRSEKEKGPFDVMGYSVDTDDASVSKITGKALAIQAGLQTTDVYWRMADDVTYAIAPADFLQLAAEASGKIEAIYAFSWQLKADIDAGTVTTFDAIETADWPT